MALDRITVRQHVGFSMREVVIRATPFTADSYHSGLVPSKAPMDGLEVDLPAWVLMLGRVEARLHAMEQAYQLLNVTVSDAQSTHNEPLHVACDLITDKIMAANEAV